MASLLGTVRRGKAAKHGMRTRMGWAHARAQSTNRRCCVVSSQINTPLVRGYHWVKMSYGDMPGHGYVTPTDSGLAWKPQSDASYLANYKAYEVCWVAARGEGFERAAF